MLKEVRTIGQVPAEALRSQRDTIRVWVENHTAQIDQYNEWVDQREPYSQRVRRWRANAGQLGKAD